MSENKSPLILVVDDEESIRRNLWAYLGDEGFEVLTVATGEEGLEILTKRAPDLAIVDIRLPGMDGNTFMIEAHQLVPCMKFLVFTGSTEYRLTDGMHALGLTEKHILKKPLDDLSFIVERIDMLLERNNPHE
ncbi:MAG TPA: response regulator [Syntrophales bacterium]|nr:response regulator [Syntrophales bacterium]